jgi:internalin A
VPMGQVWLNRLVRSGRTSAVDSDPSHCVSWYDLTPWSESPLDGPQSPRLATMPAGPFLLPWRRYLRFSVRGLIVLVLVIGLGMGWIVRSARIQREAVAAIRKAHGSVAYDWQLKSGYGAFGEPPWPRWLVHTLGVDYFGSVVSVDIPSASEDGLVHIGQLGRLRVLQIGTSDMTDAALAHLKGLSNLTYLDLKGTQVTDSGLAHLKGLTKLSLLNLSGTPVTDAGVSELQQVLPSLKIVR